MEPRHLRRILADAPTSVRTSEYQIRRHDVAAVMTRRPVRAAPDLSRKSAATIQASSTCWSSVLVPWRLARGDGDKLGNVDFHAQNRGVLSREHRIALPETFPEGRSKV